MSKKMIYIIGNGFDMHHSLKTAYFKYKTYLKSINKRLVEKLDQLMEEYGVEPDDIKYWSKLEDYLYEISQFDIDEVYDASIASQKLISIGLHTGVIQDTMTKHIVRE